MEDGRTCDRSRFGRTVRRSLILLFLFVFLLFSGGRVDAAQQTPEASPDPGDGIVLVRSMVTSGNKILAERDRTGFLAGAEDKDPCVVTSSEGLFYSDSDMDALAKKNHLEENSSLSTEVMMIFQGDLKVGLSLAASSGQKNLAVLKPDQTLTGKFALSFAPGNVRTGVDVRLLCFDGEKDNYSKATVQTYDGKVLGLGEDSSDHTKYFFHNIAGPSEICGAPFLDKDGYVVGMLTGTSEKDPEKRTALSSGEIIRFLDVNGIGYEKKKTSGGPVSEKAKSILPILLGLADVLLAVFTLVRMKQMKKKEEAWLRRISDGEMIPLDRKVLLIGSQPGKVDYVIGGNRRVSRVHAKISLQDGRYTIEDLGSTNGTYVNGRKVISGNVVRLTDGDEIRLADERFSLTGKQ